jgi:LytS/YehU family sensor histidine kinase
MTYCAFVGVLLTFNFYNRYASSQIQLERVEKRLVESRLNALRLQLEPHFLFNALNAISSELTSDPSLAREMIEDLGSLLRRSLECQHSNEITLAQELALLDRYIAIQKLRFENRVQIRIDVDPDVLTALVPSMLLQPIVENAIRHGLEGRMSGGSVDVSARRKGSLLQITVADDGIGLPARWRLEADQGLGLRVTRERLEVLYSAAGDDFFSVSPREGGGTKVVMRIPLGSSER